MLLFIQGNAAAVVSDTKCQLKLSLLPAPSCLFLFPSPQPFAGLHQIRKLIQLKKSKTKTKNKHTNQKSNNETIENREAKSTAEVKTAIIYFLLSNHVLRLYFQIFWCCVRYCHATQCASLHKHLNPSICATLFVLYHKLHSRKDHHWKVVLFYFVFLERRQGVFLSRWFGRPGWVQLHQCKEYLLRAAKKSKSKQDTRDRVGGRAATSGSFLSSFRPNMWFCTHKFSCRHCTHPEVQHYHLTAQAR